MVSGLAPNDMTRICGEDGVLIRIAQRMIRKCFEMDTFHVLRRTHCNRTSAHLTIVRLEKVDWVVTDFEGLPFDYEEPTFEFISPLPEVRRKRAEDTKVDEGDHGKVRRFIVRSTRISVFLIFTLNEHGIYSLKRGTFIWSALCWKNWTT